MRAIRLLPVLILLVAGGISGAALGAPGADAPPAAPDSTRRGSLLEKLQREDTGFYVPDIFEMNRALADSGMAALDSLGIDEFERETVRASRHLDFDINLAPHLFTYNRVEGPVVGMGPTLVVPAMGGTRLQAEGGWATATGELRHYETVTVPLFPQPETPEVQAGYTNRVEPFGSNRPTANALRALIGSADEQDYMERRGGWGELRLPGVPFGPASLRYEAFRERSVAVHTDFAVLGNHRLMESNPIIADGNDHAASGMWSLGSLAETRQELSLSHRVAGGALGGDFTYTRFDAAGAARRYLPGNFEAVVNLSYARLGGDAPYQRLADVGGLSTVRGFDRRSRVGDESVAARVEILVPYNLFARSGIPLIRRMRFQFVPWADAARVWSPVSGEDGTADGFGARPGEGEPWLTSAGLGLQYYLGPFGEGSYLRFDAAAPIGPDREDDVRFYLRFARGLF